MNKVLIIEDDKNIASLVEDALHQAEIETEWIDDGLQGLCRALEEDLALIVLDIGLPSIDGFNLCQKLRERGIQTPVLMLTSQSDVEDKILGLDLGADDYVTKPFDGNELVARIRALLRRTSQLKSQGVEPIRYRGLEIDLLRRQVRLDEKRIDLTAKEFDLLSFLAMNMGQTFSREQLMKEIWGISSTGFEPTITVHMSRLRSKLEPNQRSPIFIQTILGRGYCFSEPKDRL